MTSSIASITDLGFGGGGNLNLAVLFGYQSPAARVQSWSPAYRAVQRRVADFALSAQRHNAASLIRGRTNKPVLTLVRQIPPELGK